jgi:cyclopropane-fatty-acyl-phospholipid synthase
MVQEKGNIMNKTNDFVSVSEHDVGDVTDTAWHMGLVERGWVPDAILRWGIRRLLQQRLRQENVGKEESQQAREQQLIDYLKNGPIAVKTDAANQQHYEVPARFYELCLGKHLKYSACLWDGPSTSLDDAEAAMLALTCERAKLQDGQDVLELGCGWGSLSLYMAAKYPHSRITAVSNSHSQKQHIDTQMTERGIANLEIITCDMNVFDALTMGKRPRKFDRVVSVEMFEHMRNHEELLRRISAWMKQDALLFVHIFTHKTFTYLFEVKDASDWMSQHFFSGGMMPSDHYLTRFQNDLRLQEHWRVNGVHYAKTAEAWLKNMDRHEAEITELFMATYGEGKNRKERTREARKWLMRWRIFYLSCAELWAFNAGEEWLVSHYLFTQK